MGTHDPIVHAASPPNTSGRLRRRTRGTVGTGVAAPANTTVLLSSETPPAAPTAPVAAAPETAAGVGSVWNPQYGRSCRRLYAAVALTAVVFVIVTVRSGIELLHANSWSAAVHGYTMLHVCLATWMVGVPLWSWLEYSVFYQRWGVPGTLDLFKHRQQVVGAIWLGAAIVLGGFVAENRPFNTGNASNVRSSTQVTAIPSDLNKPVTATDAPAQDRAALAVRHELRSAEVRIARLESTLARLNAVIARGEPQPHRPKRAHRKAQLIKPAQSPEPTQPVPTG